jgi:hypothetical protein
MHQYQAKRLIDPSVSVLGVVETHTISTMPVIARDELNVANINPNSPALISIPESLKSVGSAALLGVGVGDTKTANPSSTVTTKDDPDATNIHSNSPASTCMPRSLKSVGSPVLSGAGVGDTKIAKAPSSVVSTQNVHSSLLSCTNAEFQWSQVQDLDAIDEAMLSRIEEEALEASTRTPTALMASDDPPHENNATSCATPTTRCLIFPALDLHSTQLASA